jgi:hypothetical protein
MFELKDLEGHFGDTMEIDGNIYTLTSAQDLAIWQNDSYSVYATPAFDGVAVPVHIVDCHNQEIGIDGYYSEIDNFERYCHIVKVLSEKILKRMRM